MKELDLTFVFENEDKYRPWADENPLAPVKVSMTALDLSMILTLTREAAKRNRREREEREMMKYKVAIRPNASLSRAALLLDLEYRFSDDDSMRERVKAWITNFGKADDEEPL